MYRQYENPGKLEKQLEEAKVKLEEAKEKIRQDPNNEKLWSEVEYWSLEVNELKERVNFAWQDDEAEMEGYE